MNYRSDVKGVRLARDRVIVVLETKIYVHNLADLKLEDMIDTCANPLGLCSINVVGEDVVLAVPHKEVGDVYLKREGTITCIRAH